MAAGTEAFVEKQKTAHLKNLGTPQNIDGTQLTLTQEKQIAKFNQYQKKFFQVVETYHQNPSHYCHELKNIFQQMIRTYHSVNPNVNYESVMSGYFLNMKDKIPLNILQEIASESQYWGLSSNKQTACQTQPKLLPEKLLKKACNEAKKLGKKTLKGLENATKKILKGTGKTAKVILKGVGKIAEATGEIAIDVTKEAVKDASVDLLEKTIFGFPNESAIPVNPCHRYSRNPCNQSMHPCHRYSRNPCSRPMDCYFAPHSQSKQYQTTPHRKPQTPQQLSQSGPLQRRIIPHSRKPYPQSGPLQRRVITSLRKPYPQSGPLQRKIITSLRKPYPQSGPLQRKPLPQQDQESFYPTPQPQNPSIILTRCLGQPDVTSCGFYAFYHAIKYLNLIDQGFTFKSDELENSIETWKKLEGVPDKNLNGKNLEQLIHHENLQNVIVIDSSTELNHLLNNDPENQIPDQKRVDVRTKIATLLSHNGERLAFLVQKSSENSDLKKAHKQIGHWICLGLRNDNGYIEMRELDSCNPEARGNPSKLTQQLYNFISPASTSQPNKTPQAAQKKRVHKKQRILKSTKSFTET